jgi:hypothetical protein
MFITRLATVNLARNLERQGIDQNKQHPIPRLPAIPPLMHCAALDTHIALLQRDRLAGVQEHVHLALNHNAVIQALRAVHGRRGSGRPVDHPQHGSVREGEREDGVFCFQGGGVLEVDGEGGGCPQDVVAHDVVVDFLPVAFVDELHDAFPLGVVARDEAFWFSVRVCVCHRAQTGLVVLLQDCRTEIRRLLILHGVRSYGLGM